MHSNFVCLNNVLMGSSASFSSPSTIVLARPRFAELRFLEEAGLGLLAVGPGGPAERTSSFTCQTGATPRLEDLRQGRHDIFTRFD